MNVISSKGRSVGWLVGLSKGREVSLPCSNRRTCSISASPRYYIFFVKIYLRFIDFLFVSVSNKMSKVDYAEVLQTLLANRFYCLLKFCLERWGWCGATPSSSSARLSTSSWPVSSLPASSQSLPGEFTGKQLVFINH